MICKNCNRQYDDNAQACPHCGTPKEYDAYYSTQQQPYGQQAFGAPADTNAKTKATIALVCGIIGIVLAWFVPILGIILGIIAMSIGGIAKKNLPEDQRGAATGGFICGIIAIAAGVISWIISAVVLAAMVSSFLY